VSLAPAIGSASPSPDSKKLESLVGEATRRAIEQWLTQLLGRSVGLLLTGRPV
jgi:hypothetical protein